MKNFLLLGAFYLLPITIFSQTLQLQIIDSQNNAIEFVNVYVKDANYGTISDMNGYFMLDIDKISDVDTIHFSCIGFVDKKLIKSDLVELNDNQLILEDHNYSIEGVSVTAKKINYSQKTTGSKAILNLCQTGFYVNKNNAGKEMGIIMKNKETCYLHSIHFNLEFISHDSMLYEVNIYNYQNGIKSTINQERIFIQFDKEKPANSIYLRDHNIKLTSDYFVSFEAMNVQADDWGINFKAKCKGQSLFLIKNVNGIWKEEKGINPSIWSKLDCMEE